MTAAVRANKEDPFVFLSICTAIAVAVVSWGLSHNQTVDYLSKAFMLIMFLQTVFIILIFNNWKKKKFSFCED